MKDKILKILIDEKEHISGEKISKDLNISRTTVWNYINLLKKEGYKIESVTNKGYRIQARPDLLSQTELEPYLRTQLLGRKLIHLDSVDSTNLYAREKLGQLEEGLVVVAEEQIAGKGRMGRAWLSPKSKGIWMSLVLRPNMDPSEAGKISLIGAAAVSLALEEEGINPQIKWPNDILINRKKVGGILTEMNCELNQVDYILVGIGLNVNLDLKDLPEDLKDKASSIKIEEARAINRKKLMANILNNFEELYLDFTTSSSLERTLEINRSRLVFLGEEIRLITRQGQELVQALDLNSRGELLVEDKQGKVREVFSGEISIRGINTYI